MYDDRWLRFAHWATGQAINPMVPQLLNSHLSVDLFVTHGLSPQTVKDTGPV